ncbi:MAG: ABC transporter ATP-binding protein [Rhodobiaceae bacterium]|nr:ABC transporter ATP-binding protein [Rhodobiaceae bacterium]MCC0048441.1 ABC transporter ATP-binding protein [Rhodobiaceae bacterium]
MHLETRNLAIGYPEHRVAKDINLTARTGEVLCLLGPNGSGKTTLFRTLLGLLKPLGGSITCDGAELTALPRQEIARRIAYVPQAHNAAFPFTVKDIVLMGRTAHRGAFAAPSPGDHDAAMEALASLGMDGLENREYTRISGGQRQLVLIARALAQAAPLIVMDEPTASLDFGNQIKVLSRVRALADQGPGVVLSTHDPDHAFAVGDRVVFLDQGGIVAEGAPRDVLTPERLMAAYGIDVDIVELAGGQTVCAPAYRNT